MAKKEEENNVQDAGLDMIINQVRKKPSMANQRNIYKPRFTPQELLFIEGVVNHPEKSMVQICKEVYPTSSQPGTKVKTLLKKEEVVAEIERREEIARYRASYAAEDVIEHLWKEATKEGRGSSQLARINALQLLGRHIDLFGAEKKKEESKAGNVTFNTINYAGYEPKKIEKEVQEVKDVPNLIEEQMDTPQGITITDFSDQKVETK